MLLKTLTDVIHTRRRKKNIRKSATFKVKHVSVILLMKYKLCTMFFFTRDLCMRERRVKKKHVLVCRKKRDVIKTLKNVQSQNERTAQKRYNFSNPLFFIDFLEEINKIKF
jgi:hypothetical protein